jgi:glycosyltransferase involved in cell wall biosynthesis
MDAMPRPRLALVHDWLTGMRGGEKCLEVLCREFPGAPIHTLIHQVGSTSPEIDSHPVKSSRLNHLPKIERYYRYLLPLMPWAARWNVRDCDLVLSFSHCVAKAAVPPPGIPHVCYCFTPMRYAWHMKEQYFGSERVSLKTRGIDIILSRIREWDRKISTRVTHFIAISRTIRDRIRDSYDRDSTVIYPPVDTKFYTPTNIRRENFFLVVSAFAPYKRLDLALEACRRLGRKLVLIGKGQNLQKLKNQYAGDDRIQFLGWQSDQTIRDYLRRSQALLFPGEEDFGIVPLEANACGTPVIAYARGGATETIKPLAGSAEPTGVFFDEQSVDSLVAAIETFERSRSAFSPLAARANAQKFSQDRFRREMLDYISSVLAEGGQRQRRAA